MIKNLRNALFLLAALAPAARAQMLNHVVDAEWRYPTFPTILEAHTFTVDGSVELPTSLVANSGNLSIDLGDDWVEISFSSGTSWGNTTFNGWLFRDSQGTLPPIIGYTIDSFSPGIGNLSAITTGFNENECWANLASMTVVAAGDFIRFRVKFHPGTAYCFGDASDTACNCGNVGSFGEGCSNSTGVGSTLTAAGAGTIAANDLVLHASQLPANTPTLFFAGDLIVSPGVLLGDGLLCAGGQITRLEVLFSNSQGMASTSVGLAAALGAVPGAQSSFQAWYRDPPGPCSTGFNTSNAIHLVWE